MGGGGKASTLPAHLQDRIDAIETNQRDTDAQAFQKAVERRARVSFSVGIAGFGVLMFLLASYLLCTSGIGDPELTAQFHAKADPNAYTWPMVAFSTAFGLNFITLLFERESAKFQLALLACYINFLAGFNDYLSWRGYSPIVRDSWGQGFQLLRTVMWLLTTPAMVYLLSIISDFSRIKVYSVMLADVLMISFGILAFLAFNKYLSILLYLVAWFFFSYVVYSMWTMFHASIAEARHDSSRVSLEVLRVFAVGLWFTFPIIWIIVKLGLVDVHTEEWMWCVCDFLGKVMFSSSLLHGNFLTIEQRRLIAMRIVEEGNRIQVIQELKDLVEQKERFMSSMSHELRTPLNGIIGLSDALLVGSCGDVNDQALKTITTIKTSGARLLNLINDILDAASMRKGKLTIKHEKVNLKRVVDDVIDLCQPLAKRGVKLVNDLREHVPFVLGDTGRIIQIFHNLIGNSCKFTHNGFISIAASAKDDEVEVAVSDTGIGIPEDKFDQIFLAFEQVDMSVTRKYGGTGLGLNLVKQLVEAHGGRISVKSKEGQGTTFFFTLKIHSEHPNDGQPQGTSTEPVAAPAEHTQLANVRSTVAAAGPGSNMPHSTPRRAPSRRGSFTDKMLGAVAKKAPSETGKSSLGPQQPGATSGLVSGSHAQNAGSARAVAAVAASAGATTASAAGGGSAAAGSPQAGEGLQGGSGGGALGGSAARGVSASGTASGPFGLGPTRTSKDGGGGGGGGAQSSRSVMAGPQVSGPMSLNDAAALMKGTLKRRSSFREKGGKVRVLSVDDDPVNQLVIQNLLAPVGYEILQAMDGQEALQVLTSEERLPDVILLDVMMPGMSGYEVCRKLREMYPLSCIPVIMISAKSKEEHIVEGLAAGSNDYVVKPFGRQEILARIAAHLRFRDTVYQAGEIAGAIPGEVLPGRVLLRGGTGGALDLAPFLTGPARFTSLPNCITRGIEAGTTSTTLQMFDQLTLLQVGIPNLADLIASVAASELLVALSALFHDLDTLLEQHGCYLLEGLDEQFTIVSGLDNMGDQVLHSLGLARSLLAAADTSALGSKRLKLNISIGIHTGPAQGVLVGHSHPVMYFTGQLPSEVFMLQQTCPANCVHVSARVVEAVGGEREHFVPAGNLSCGSTYLMKAGGWDGGGMVAVSDATARWAKTKRGINNAVNTEAKRMRPIQLALLAMAQANAGFLVDIASLSPEAKDSSSNVSANAPMPTLADGPAGQTPAGSGAAADPEAAAAAAAEIAKLRKEYESLEKQLEEVSNEAARLQDLVDDLEEQLISTNGSSEAASAQAAAAAAELATLRGQVAELEGQLEEAAKERSGLEAALAEMEHRLVETHAALATANQEAADRARALASTIPPEPRIETTSIASGSEAGFGGGNGNTGGSSGAIGNGGGSSGHALGLAMSGVVGGGGLFSGGGILAHRQAMPLGMSMRFPNLAALRAHGGDMRAVLEDLGLSSLAARFEAEDVSPGLLPYLDDTALRELGATSVGARLKLRIAAQALFMG
ncbi:hypothetical protein Vretimale_10018 [Volvox reticuliferus]|uniref:histidine kinase n=1 Tax=Volvox reticuliferus TaxID=1737510 RepID=A0A8J4BWL4_9CHLO|nr:hypothetical protein Vretifemale_795 [Volvox reticuliferus]GIM05589.1 hypothetical protein Vretimale_10018 [Volvox reticuliferus]